MTAKNVCYIQTLCRGFEEGQFEHSGENNYISIAALEATLVNGEKEGEEKSTVTSDYAAIMPMIQGFKAIAYTDDSKIVTKTLVNLNCIRQLRKLSKTYILFLHNTMVVLLNWQIYCVSIM